MGTKVRKIAEIENDVYEMDGENVNLEVLHERHKNENNKVSKDFID